MISCPRDVFRDAIAHGVIAKAGGAKVKRVASQLSGNSTDGGSAAVDVLEYAVPGGETIARRVAVGDHCECWLRHDLATDTLIARADAVAAVERIKRELTAEMNAGDQVLALARGETLEHFRTQRNYRGMRFERWQRAQRAGRG